ncbi:exported hypothetical protein [Cupriavidus taiwanensis]|nr:exported hypothetical protein [Cupriavidus taiwanensis]SOZ26373.1 exported hypothetical protein [Cupriavidus taiwanensis]SOZ45237.1 exported hypothetical protein [Cupriavidus taiwanensis]
MPAPSLTGKSGAISVIAIFPQPTFSALSKIIRQQTVSLTSMRQRGVLALYLVGELQRISLQVRASRGRRLKRGKILNFL